MATSGFLTVPTGKKTKQNKTKKPTTTKKKQTTKQKP